MRSNLPLARGPTVLWTLLISSLALTLRSSKSIVSFAKKELLFTGVVTEIYANGGNESVSKFGPSETNSGHRIKSRSADSESLINTVRKRFKYFLREIVMQRALSDFVFQIMQNFFKRKIFKAETQKIIDAKITSKCRISNKLEHITYSEGKKELYLFS